MNQQDQQFRQEKTENKPAAKTNWKFIAIVVVLAWGTRFYSVGETKN